MAESALDSLAQVLPLMDGILAPEDKTAHLLVVDDDPQIVKLCRLFLANVAPPESAGVETEIHTASSGEEALAIVERLLETGDRVACALVDVMMPGGMDGIETISRIWEVDPDVQCTLVTGAGKRIEAEIAPKRGEAFISVVSTQQEAVFGAAGEHAIRFARRLCNEIVEHHADVRLIALQTNWSVAESKSSGVETGN